MQRIYAILQTPWSNKDETAALVMQLYAEAKDLGQEVEAKDRIFWDLKVEN